MLLFVADVVMKEKSFLTPERTPVHYAGIRVGLGVTIILGIVFIVGLLEKCLQLKGMGYL
jgi:pilus assembly protein TadC